MKNKCFEGLVNGVIISVLIWILIIIVSCDFPGSTGNAKVENSNTGFNIICVDNVEYLIKMIGYTGFMAPHLKTDGTPYTCERMEQ